MAMNSSGVLKLPAISVSPSAALMIDAVGKRGEHLYGTIGNNNIDRVHDLAHTILGMRKVEYI